MLILKLIKEFPENYPKATIIIVVIIVAVLGIIFMTSDKF